MRAVEKLARPPLTDIEARLRLLADELPSDATAAIVVLVQKDQHIPTHAFGNADCRFRVAGYLAAAIDAQIGGK